MGYRDCYMYGFDNDTGPLRGGLDIPFSLKSPATFALSARKEH